MKTKWWAIVLIIFCTFCTSSAAIFNKYAANKISLTLNGTLYNYYIYIALFLLGTGFGLLMLALRGGDVTVLYPIIATSFIWVTVFAYFLFNEELSFLKLLGVFIIIVGIVIVKSGDKE